LALLQRLLEVEERDRATLAEARTAEWMRTFDWQRLHDLSQPPPPLVGGEVMSLHEWCTEGEAQCEGSSADAVWDDF
jgi:hypothetical protein